ncbi:LEAF RUST 10 DISEASE-RESISTANCE LOCUS RECEPTOR-LIKE PROTEIN KINASE-like 2.2 [Cryptomeria japonica]|uniref:LEAF RUST 10 DISEASE-RESISTANCE LOCUS RECEPTOR-LIKE PROTEIN KINASE-like 2.2 n=1 Tax=Cryptomeria japonica TaxID=3369 RepID=UPI0027DA5119|nr:LEAF RUST 10 DISEASE-RESISTANCE LOCUS RECEPTOR-LIKE PROTEIN KINASE-like 2.2 [Cryptomeria japonica]
MFPSFIHFYFSFLPVERRCLHPHHSKHCSVLALCHSHFLFLVFTISISYLATSSRPCPEFICGDYVFQHPFREKKSGCGDPALQLECDHQANMPLINIGGYQYYILHPENLLQGSYDYNLTLIDGNLLGPKCNPSSSIYIAQIWTSTQFHVTKQYKNLTLWEQCNETEVNFKDIASPLPCNGSWFYISKPRSSLTLDALCKSQVKLPVESVETPVREEILHEGFQIQWNISGNCMDCLLEKGLCSYYTDSMHFCCNCTDTGCRNKCSAGKSQAMSIILGVVIGTTALLLMGALLLFLNRKRCLPNSSKKPDLSNVEKFLQDYVHQIPCRYSYSQLMKITNKFAHRVGEGGFGVVYKGRLSTGDLVAVKMLDQSRRCESHFMNEIATIGRIHHVHLVRLMGYYYEEHRNALVYEYMANGSLEQFIFSGKEKKQILNRAKLYSIALGSARGIAYLHQDCDNRIIHFDIKPHNILLDEEFTPKVADFGLAKLCGKKEDHISMTAARGTPGYAAPEVWNRNLGAVTDKSDVYSFGMVLLEVVGGRNNVEVQVSRSSQLYFPEWAFKLMETGQLERTLRGSGNAEIECEEKEKAIRLAKGGLWCIQYNSRDRPSMSRVVQMLEGNGDDGNLYRHMLIKNHE